LKTRKKTRRMLVKLFFFIKNFARTEFNRRRYGQSHFALVYLLLLRDFDIAAERS
jgi:hypothetical protein